MSAANGDKTSYKGLQKGTKECALIFDPATQTFTLERIDTEFSFGQGRASPASEDGILDALIDQEGTADTNDPYDWRHQLKRHRTPTPDIEPFDPFGADALQTPSPERKPTKPRPKPRKASTPPEEPTIEPEASTSSEPEPEATSQHEDEEEQEEDSDDGGLQIVMDGAAKPRHGFRNDFGRGRFNQRLDAAPISLRSAASSQSPAMHNADDSDESDEDVDEMKLGSPMTERRRDAEADPEDEPTQEPEVDVDDVDMDAEFARAMEGDDEDEPAVDGAADPTTTAYVDESSSESEAE